MQLVPEREDEQTKLQILVMELKAERRHGESEERACERLLERLEAPGAKPAAVDAPESKPASVDAPESKPTSVREEEAIICAPESEPPPAVSAPAETDDLRVFLTGLGLAHLEPRFIEQELELSMMRSASEAALTRDLTDIGVSVGARRKIITAIEQRAHCLVGGLDTLSWKVAVAQLAALEGAVVRAARAQPTDGRLVDAGRHPHATLPLDCRQ